jgi:hypothetical protein
VLLAHRLAGDALAPNDRALATELVYGTLVWQGRLDHFLGRLLHEPLERPRSAGARRAPARALPAPRARARAGLRRVDASVRSRASAPAAS